jgi:hypothetical protein
MKRGGGVRRREEGVGDEKRDGVWTGKWEGEMERKMLNEKGGGGEEEKCSYSNAQLMKKISEIEEKPFKSSLNICPEVCL